jgi:hypothetical protein
MSAVAPLPPAIRPTPRRAARLSWRVALAASLCLASAAPVLLLPADAIAQDKGDKKGKDKPGKKVEPLISQLPGIADEARCQAEIAVTAFKRLGALSVLPYMPSALANAAAAGSSAAMSYCAQNPKACADASDALMSRIGEMPTSCGG